ncbi:hypothetical protein PM082_000584 [Marasmius tenuissimus]|nr:hypothetical protein PM082_000584 [Marasmius tenuissimus]
MKQIYRSFEDLRNSNTINWPTEIEEVSLEWPRPVGIGSLTFIFGFLETISHRNSSLRKLSLIFPVEDSGQDIWDGNPATAPTFPNLSHLDTNLPHNILAPLFISNLKGSSKLSDVRVAHCGEDICPFDRIQVESTRDRLNGCHLEGPPQCVAALALLLPAKTALLHPLTIDSPVLLAGPSFIDLKELVVEFVSGQMSDHLLSRQLLLDCPSLSRLTIRECWFEPPITDDLYPDRALGDLDNASEGSASDEGSNEDSNEDMDSTIDGSEMDVNNSEDEDEDEDEDSGGYSLPWSDTAEFTNSVAKLTSLTTLLLQTWSVGSTEQCQLDNARTLASGTSVDVVEIVWGMPGSSQHCICIDKRVKIV